MKYINQNKSFYERYVSTVDTVGKLFIDTICGIYHNVFLEIDKGKHECTLIKGDEKNITEEYESSDKIYIHHILYEMTKDYSHDIPCNTIVQNQICKLPNKNSNIIIVDERFPKNLISKWCIEDNVIKSLNQTRLEPVIIEPRYKRLSFWKFYNDLRGVIIGDYIYPANTVMYYEEFIGESNPVQRIEKKKVTYDTLKNADVSLDIFIRPTSLNGHCDFKFVIGGTK